MPGAQKTEKSRRVERCVFTESGQRCRRSGTGDPPICNAHRVAFVEAAKEGSRPKGARRVGDGLYDLVERFVTGRRVTKKVARDAYEDARNIMDEVMQAQANGTFRFPAGFTPPAGWGARRAPPDPEAAKRAAKQKLLMRARQALGFTPSEPLTVDVVKKRHRELARKYHPDRGGSLDKMKEINASVDVLLGSLVP